MPDHDQPADLRSLALRAKEQYRAAQAALLPGMDRDRLEQALLPLQETIDLLLLLTAGTPPDDPGHEVPDP